MCKKVDIIIVNWNSAAMTMKAVAPYINYITSGICCNLIVVDNGSTDESTYLFKNKVNKVISNIENVGFAKACNQALEKSSADYILLLNPDTLSSPVVLEHLVTFLDNNLEYGITGPAQVDGKGKIVRTCGRFPTFKTALFEILGLSKILPRVFAPVPIMTDWDHLESRDVGHVMGSYMVIRKSMLDKVGFMDDDYFVYLEDVDLSKRFANGGFKTFYNKEYAVFHEGGGTGQKLKAKRLFYYLSSRGVYWKKHLGRMSYMILTAVSLTVEPFLRIIDLLFKEKKFHLKIIGKAYVMYVRKMIRS